MNRNMLTGDLTDEKYREYEFNGKTYRINNPKKFFMRIGGTTHRILDNDNVVHTVPAPGVGDCVLRWKPRSGRAPVKF